MPKRKAGVNDIIYELDNDDIEISSDEEAKEPKINRIDTNNSEEHVMNTIISEENKLDIINIDCSSEDIDNNTLTVKSQNGGKTLPVNILEQGKNIINNGESLKKLENDVESNKKLGPDGSKTTIFNEDIVIDSPASNSDLGVVGCENRTPLVTIRFRDNKMAKNYKHHLKTFMLNLIKLHDEENFAGSETETDLELDIWPEDLIDEEFEDKKKEPEDSLFFIDTAPCENVSYEIPKYKQVSTLISNVPDREPSPPQVVRRGPICFNCDGNHPLRDCTAPKNKARIAEKRKNMAVRVGRYHVEDEQKYGHLMGGRISGQLRHALGLKRHELPLHIYRMRLLGYPPGWLEEARISHSGITMFDSTGTAILDPEEEEGEVCEPGSKDKFDIKKILDFPGFNVPASSRYKEEAHLYNLPQMSEQDSKMAMLQMLAPNAMKAYKRKKLTFFPSAPLDNSLQEGQAEMELDSGDETADFPSVPPLPDEAPPTVPMPPPSPPLPPPPPPDDDVVTINLDESQEEKTESSAHEISDSVEIVDDIKNDIPLPTSEQRPEAQQLVTIDIDSQTDDENNSSVKEINVDVIETDKLEAADIPMPDDDSNVANDDEKLSSGRGSPSLDDLEIKKRLLLQALEGSQDSADIIMLDDTEKEEINQTLDSTEDISKIDDEINDSITVLDKQASSTPSKVDSSNCKDSNLTDNDSEISKTPDSKAGHIKTTAYGTPIVNVASTYLKLPTDEKFAKDICDVINFENLPNSTGKYKQISNLLKKVKNEVDRIQDS
ncbi:LOW QUALITY PROTEIN: zinc finger CCHC domain-containing protein 8 homolog [Aphomia sociella]